MPEQKADAPVVVQTGEDLEVTFKFPAPSIKRPASTEEELRAMYLDEARRLFPSYEQSCNMVGLRDRLTTQVVWPKVADRTSKYLRDYLMTYDQEKLAPFMKGKEGEEVKPMTRRDLLIGVAEEMVTMLKSADYEYLDQQNV